MVPWTQTARPGELGRKKVDKASPHPDSAEGRDIARSNANTKWFLGSLIGLTVIFMIFMLINFLKSR